MEEDDAEVCDITVINDDDNNTHNHTNGDDTEDFDRNEKNHHPSSNPQQKANKRSHSPQNTTDLSFIKKVIMVVKQTKPVASQSRSRQRRRTRREMNTNANCEKSVPKNQTSASRDKTHNQSKLKNKATGKGFPQKKTSKRVNNDSRRKSAQATKTDTSRHCKQHKFPVIDLIVAADKKHGKKPEIAIIVEDVVAEAPKKIRTSIVEPALHIDKATEIETHVFSKEYIFFKLKWSDKEISKKFCHKYFAYQALEDAKPLFLTRCLKPILMETKE